MRARRFVTALMIAMGVTGCGSEKDPAMPDVTGKKLDVAQSDIKRAGFAGKPEVLGGGAFGVLKESNWEVCEQTPDPGEPLTEAPRMTVDRDCNSPTPTPMATEASDTSPRPITDITVDALLDQLNSNIGNLGDRFRFTGELFQSDLWTTGASGDFSVLLKAQGGKQDLLVFVNESDAKGWQNGTRVEMVVENVQVTINGETTDGWLRAEWVKTLPPVG